MKLLKKASLAVIMMCVMVLCTVFCAANVSAAAVTASGECGDSLTWTLYDDGEYEVREIISGHAFEDADLSDVIMQYNHEGRVFARVSNGTLRILPDEKGLAIEADLGGTELGAQVYSEIAGGYTDKMSIGMKIDRSRDVWTTEELAGKVIETRTVNRIVKLYDVSAVSIPANDATSISVRTLVDGAIDRLKAERLEAQKLELERRRAEVRARALGGKK